MSRPRTPTTILVKSTDAAASKLNAGVAMTWNAGRRLAKATAEEPRSPEDLDFNALSASVQAVLAHARRRGVPDVAILMGVGAGVGPLLATVPSEDREEWVDRLSRLIHASARMTEVSVATREGGSP